MKLLDKLLKIKLKVQESGEYIGSQSTRADISDLYKSDWLPISQEFKQKFGDQDFKIVDENSFQMYELMKAQKPYKSKVLAKIKAIETVLEKIEINSIREQGSHSEIEEKLVPPETESTFPIKNITLNNGKVENRPSRNGKAVFVIHGRNLTIRDSMFNFLRSIDLHPLEWSELINSIGNGAPYVGEILEKAFSEAQAIVVLMTPDDEGRLTEHLRGENEPLHEKELTPQARLNVIFEAGMAMGSCPQRTIIVEIGHLRSFSDIAGRHTIRLDDTPEKRHDLVQRLQAAGCEVNTRGTAWLKAGTFRMSDKIEKSKTPNSGPYLLVKGANTGKTGIDRTGLSEFYKAEP